ncbi:PREDICTED: 60S acidic ribosomal protein P0-like [Camelina sativa]|uniref:60S acidic ribosomal protein P0-like n=1 Tax=Camelina sativa TaxID=90675 RepID=A0ABM0XSE6_CAMSA|nr:PREDICTED: 60S acidic ribosomal protein P0-like [Camelina sativa]
MVKATKAEKKIAYDTKLCQLIDEYTQILVVAADNVGSTQLQNIRKGLRGDSVVLMGKNTMMILRKHIPNLAASRGVLVLYIRDNKRASLRLGELVKLKTALAIGVKTRGNELNLLLQQILPSESLIL